MGLFNPLLQYFLSKPNFQNPEPPSLFQKHTTQTPKHFSISLSAASSVHFPSMAARILANVLVAGSMVLGRAVVQAYQKAIQNANKTGVAQEALNNIQRVRKAMTEQEARLILGTSEKSTWPEILQRYDALFEKNAKNGSFYIQSKVHRAKECLEIAYQNKGGPAT